MYSTELPDFSEQLFEVLLQYETFSWYSGQFGYPEPWVQSEPRASSKFQGLLSILIHSLLPTWIGPKRVTPVSPLKGSGCKDGFRKLQWAILRVLGKLPNDGRLSHPSLLGETMSSSAMWWCEATTSSNSRLEIHSSVVMKRVQRKISSEQSCAGQVSIFWSTTALFIGGGEEHSCYRCLVTLIINHNLKQDL